MLLLAPAELENRRRAARRDLAPLAQSLSADLDRAMSRELFVPSEKAKLTRIGGRCAKDGTLLTFDPFQPHQHACPRCQARYHEVEHYRWWIMSYQLWLAERAVHAATLYTLLGDERHRKYAEAILTRYSASYASYPNSDNVLGPSRLFFSTYLESIWLLEICIAVDLLEAENGESAVTRAARSAVVQPAADIIRGYDEGDSNRQVWNNAALLAAARVLGERDAIDAVVYGDHGVTAHLDRALLKDGTWYEGENYHQFAHRGLWYGVTLAERAGVTLPAESLARFQEGFATPFLSALPDFTFPARRDSPHRVSLRQWRYAESCELGLARGDDSRLLGALHALYEESGASDGDTGRWRSAGESERNEPPVRLSRADLGWRSLLHARPTLPPLRAASPGSILLEGQGLAVFRRARGRLYAALDYGESGGGHGHPDRLNVLLVDGDERWLDDWGTGSYVDPSLHWYRSTLAHNAPMFGGHSQPRRDGILIAHDERGAAGWVRAAVPGLAKDAAAERALIVMPDYVVDRLAWSLGPAAWLDLPLHVEADVDRVEWEDATLEGGEGKEDGFAFVTSARRARALDREIRFTARSTTGATLDGWIFASEQPELWRLVAPGPPGESERAFLLLRFRGKDGSVSTVLSPRSAVTAVKKSGSDLDVALRDGSRHIHRVTADGWQVELNAGGARSSIDLGGLRKLEPTKPRAEAVGGRETPIEVSRGRAATFELGESHYRRSELPWREAGAPSAMVVVGADPGRLSVEIHVRKKEPIFASPRDINPLDNERSDINSDGVQLYLKANDRNDSGEIPGGAWLMVPDENGTVRVSDIDSSARALPMTAEWKRTGDGYMIRCVIGIVARSVGLEVVVNDISRDRERRRGQLVLTGGHGEFIYLRGDRHTGRWAMLRING